MNCHVGAGNWTQVLYKKNQCLQLLLYLSRQGTFQFFSKDNFLVFIHVDMYIYANVSAGESQKRELYSQELAL